MKNKFVFIGPIGSGKGTQADYLKEKFGLAHFSTGDMFRSVSQQDTPEGKKIKEILASGALVPDAVTNEVVDHILSQADLTKGFVLDGYPRTIAQAETLEKMLEEKDEKLDAVISIDIPDALVIERIVGRFSCVKCKKGYHERFNQPKKPGVCDVCGSTEFIYRDDDKEDVVKERLKKYHQETEPLKAWYGQKGLLIDIDGTDTIENVGLKIEKELEQ